MQNIILIFSFLFLQNLQGKGSENYLLLLYKGGFSIYDVSKKDSLLSYRLSDDKKWQIGKTTIDGDVINILLHDEQRFIGSNFDKSINEIEFSINVLSTDVLILGERVIIQRDSGLFLEGSGEVLDNIHFKKRYAGVTKYYSEDGDLYLLNDLEKQLFLARKSEALAQCGYYQPESSFDDKLLVCEYRCSKFNGKKLKEPSQIIEIEIPSKTINKLQLYGYNPTYSPDGIYILYKDNLGHNIYSKETHEILHLTGIKQARWIK